MWAVPTFILIGIQDQDIAATVEQLVEIQFAASVMAGML
jgi:hypothetical protein